MSNSAQFFGVQGLSVDQIERLIQLYFKLQCPLCFTDCHCCKASFKREQAASMGESWNYALSLMSGNVTSLCGISDISDSQGYMGEKVSTCMVSHYDDQSFEVHHFCSLINLYSSNGQTVTKERSKHLH